MGTPTISSPPLSPEDAEKYAGQWVALRAGEVVAAAESFDELLNKDEVEAGDAFYHVPSRSTLYY